MYYYCTQLTLCLKQLSLLSHRNETLTQVPSPSCSWRMKSTDVGLDIAADPELQQKKSLSIQHEISIIRFFIRFE